MDNIQYHIKTAEDKWLNLLTVYCKNLFDDKKILSHDHSHHLRVWEYSKEILNAINSSYRLDYNFIEATLIASLFHDTGLTQNLNENHGKESSKICSDYFERTSIEIPSNFKEILHAIEMHDDKDYKLNSTSPETVLSVLCNADDMDAFGRIGVIRYTEIYLLRGISTNELPHFVIKNLNKRFANFERTYKSYKALYEKHKERYMVTRKFFEKLQEEITSQ